ncbi:MAG: biotin/lipoyl-binding protein [Clostridiaceae bacterium]|nr:biotin/lipoyl-binding protein [Clostridiaceae bacterium]MBW4860316.1 biotin/lipoyl-binding protein [Clostridiaceae bacterium]MBW4868893.1 biotin/lipoyl-binding protein [Clostridiaceae bacterium]
MSRKKKIALIIIGIAILVLATTAIFFGRKNKKEETKEKTIERYAVPSRDNVFVNGIISPRTEQVLSTDPSKGKVEKIHIEDGAEVKKGTPLITYKREEITEQISELKNQLEELKDSKKKEEAIRNQPETTVTEGEESQLLESNLGSQMTDYNSQIKKIEREISNLKNKEYTVEYSNLDGIGSVEKVSLGEGLQGDKIIVQSYDFVATGTINEVDLFKLKEGMSVEMTLVANERKKTGKIESISQRPSSEGMSGEGMTEAFGGGGNESTFSEYPIKFSIDNQEGLIQGFHVQVKIPYGKNSIMIPDTAIFKENNKTFVFLIKDNILKKHEIEIGKKEDGNVLVTKGLKEKDELVVDVTEDLKEGDEVE